MVKNGWDFRDHGTLKSSELCIISIWLTIKPNNLRTFCSQISVKHDQASIFVEGVL